MALLARVLQLLGLALLLGAWLLESAARGTPAAPRARLLQAAAASLGLALVLSGGLLDLARLAAQLAGAGPLDPAAWAGIPTLVRDTAYGRLLALRGVLAAATTWLLLASGAEALRPLVTLGLVTAFALGGHAQTGSVPWLAVPLQAIHTGAAAAWFGGLSLLAALARGVPVEELVQPLGRFSRLGPIGMAVLAASGVAVAGTRLFSPYDLVETGYGRVLALKLLWVGSVLALAALNRHAVRSAGTERRPPAAGPRGGEPWWARALRVGLLAEAAAGLGVLTLAAALAQTPPPLGPADRYRVVMDEYRFEPAELRVRAGRVARVTVVNRGQTVHDWSVPDLPYVGGTITGASVHHPEEGFLHVHLAPGQRASVEFIPLQPGRYRVLCTVWPHAQRGMTAWLVVEP